MRQKSFSEVWTHKGWSTAGICRQIDFIVLDEIRADSFVNHGISNTLEGKSDHQATSAIFKFDEKTASRKQRQKTQVGWRPQLDDSGLPAEYHKLLDEALGKLESSSDPTALVVKAATDSKRKSTSGEFKTHSKEIQELFDTRRSACDPIERKKLSKQLWRALRNQRRRRLEEELENLATAGAGQHNLKRLLDKQKGLLRINSVRDISGEVQSDPDSIAEVFAVFYEDLYKDAVKTKFVPDESTKGEVQVTEEDVRIALRRLKNKKTAADDGLVAEMLKTDHEGLLEAIAAFYTKASSKQYGAPDGMENN